MRNTPDQQQAVNIPFTLRRGWGWSGVLPRGYWVWAEAVKEGTSQRTGGIAC